MHNLQPESHLSRAMFDSSSQRLFCFIHHMLIKITSLAQMELTNLDAGDNGSDWKDNDNADKTIIPMMVNMQLIIMTVLRWQNQWWQQWFRLMLKWWVQMTTQLKMLKNILARKHRRRCGARRLNNPEHRGWRLEGGAQELEKGRWLGADVECRLVVLPTSVPVRYLISLMPGPCSWGRPVLFIERPVPIY